MNEFPDIDKLAKTGTEFTTPTRYDPEVKARAYELYLNSDLDTSDIAIEIGVPRVTVAKWASAGKWRERKEDIEVELMRRAEDSYRSLILQNRGPVLKRHLRISEKLENTIEKIVDDATRDDGIPSDMKIKRLAEALSSVTGISARAAAINDRPFGDQGAPGSTKQQKAQKVPLVAIGIQAQVAPDRAPKDGVTLTVTSPQQEEGTEADWEDD